MITKAARNEVKDEGVSQGRVGILDFTGAGVTATVSGNTATINVPGGGLTLTEIDQPIATAGPLHASRSGRFEILGSGFTVGKSVFIIQVPGPYLLKGTRADEAEMDSIILTGKVRNSTTIDVYWTSQHRVRGFYRFGYLVTS